MNRPPITVAEHERLDAEMLAATTGPARAAPPLSTFRHRTVAELRQRGKL